MKFFGVYAYLLSHLTFNLFTSLSKLTTTIENNFSYMVFVHYFNFILKTLFEMITCKFHGGR
jgi:hypothetical protein